MKSRLSELDAKYMKEIQRRWDITVNERYYDHSLNTPNPIKTTYTISHCGSVDNTISNGRGYLICSKCHAVLPECDIESHINDPCHASWKHEINHIATEIFIEKCNNGVR